MGSQEMTLWYFDIRGLAETSRLLLHDKGIHFTDKKVQQSEWPAVKPTMPFGQMPCLFEGGVPLAQSGAIIRHLARKFNLYGSDIKSAAFIDMFYEGIGDLRKKYYDYIYRDAETKEAFVTKTAHDELEKLYKLGAKHGNFSHFVLGDKISFADYALFEMLDILLVLDGSILDKFPNFKTYHETFAKRETLAPYLNSAERKNMKINGNGKQ